MARTADELMALVRESHDEQVRMLWAVADGTDDGRLKEFALELLRLQDAHWLTLLEAYQVFKGTQE